MKLEDRGQAQVSFGQSTYSNQMSQKLFQAIEFASKAHTGQFRKGTQIPYIVHPLGVAKILIESDCSEEVACPVQRHLRRGAEGKAQSASKKKYCQTD